MKKSNTLATKLILAFRNLLHPKAKTQKDNHKTFKKLGYTTFLSLTMLVMIGFNQHANAQTTLAAGDIAVIGYNSNGNPDNFAILVLNNLSAGTVFYINDNEVTSAGGTSFTDLSEGEASFTVKSGQTVTAGTVIVLPWGAAAVSTTTYDYSSTSNFGLGNNNEEIYIYTAPAITSITPTTFIYYAKIGTSTSAIPSGLTLGITAIAPTGSGSRYKTTGATYSGNSSQLLSAIGNTATNWTGTGATSLAASDWAFTVTTCVPPTTISVSNNGPVCEGNTLNLFATANGTFPAAYQWSGPSGFASGSQNPSISNVTTAATGVYTVFAVNSCGTTSSSVSATVNSLPTATITPDGSTTFCSGGSVNLTASASNSYLWSTGVTTSSISVSTTGTFTVTITNANGCTASTSTTTTVNAIPTPSISGALAFCSGSSTTLDAGSFTSYNWSTGAGTQTISVNAAGTYTVTVTDANGCTGSVSATTTINPIPAQPGAFTAKTTFVYLGQMGLVYTVPSQAGATYNWTYSGTGATINGSGNGITIDYSPTATSGALSVTASSNGCTSTARTLAIVLNSPITFPTANLDYSFVTVGCNRVDYLDSAFSSGDPDYSCGASTANVYQLKRLFTEISQMNPLPHFLIMTGDIVMGYKTPSTPDTTELAKQLTAWRAIYENHPLSTMGITLIAIPGNHETQDKNAGKHSFLAAEQIFTRIMAPYILGSNGPGIGGPDGLTTDQSKLTYSFNYGGDHYIIINTDPVGKDNEAPYKWIASDIQTARANNARHIFAFGHKPAYSSPYTPAGGLDAPTTLASRDSLWKYLENNNCEAMFSAHEHLWDSIEPHAGKTWQVINGDGGTRVEPVWVGTGKQYYGYTLVNLYNNLAVNVMGVGRNTTQSPTAGGLPYPINEDANPSTVRNNFNICLTTTSTTALTACGSYTWNSITYSSSGTYTYTTINAAGCDSIATLNLTINALPIVSISGTLSFCEGSSTTLDAGTFTSYNWSIGASTQTITVSTAGTFTVTVTNANGCTASASVATTVNPLPTVSFTLVTSYIYSSVVTLTGTPSGGTFSGPGVSGNTFTAATAGVGGPYTITYSYTNGNGCSNSVTHTTSVLPVYTGPSSSASPYVLPTSSAPGVTTTSVLSTPDVIGGYEMEGIPDGLGAFDNGNGTFTLLMNHELQNSGSLSGVTRAHGSKGAFVSKWIINKTTLAVQSGSDLMQNVNLWNTGTSSYTTYNAGNPSTLAVMGRYCSADLPPVSAFYNSGTGLGTLERIFMNGEETNDESRGFAHIVTGTNAGTSWELPALGKGAWENSVANPATQNKTVVAEMNDGTDGQVYIYIGTKTNTGTEIEKAGLTNGHPFGVKVTGFPVERVNSTTINNPPAPGTHFDLVDLGDVRNITGAIFNTNSNTAGITKFSRPEDGAWDPNHPNDFYFNTTDQIDQVADGIGTSVGRSRVWKLHFTDILNPELGGTIEAVLDGTEGQNMLDNMAIDHYGHILLQEDVGNAAHNGKMWQYTIATDNLKQIAKHDPSRFGDIGLVATAPFNQDEETSGIIDVQDILGAGMFLSSDQAHYLIPGAAAEGGQLFELFNPDTYNSSLCATTSTTTVSACDSLIWNGTKYTSSGSYTYHTTNAAGCDSAATLNLTINTLPGQPANFTTSSATVNAGQSGVAYTIPNVAAATGYNWTYSGTGATVNGSGNSVTVDFSSSATSGTLSVTATNSCGTGTARTISITVNPLSFTSGRLVVLQTTGTVSKASSPATLKEFTTTGVGGITVAIPATGSTPFQTSGVFGGSEGFLTTSFDGKLLVLGGYGTAASFGDITGTMAASVARVVGSVAQSGSYTQVASSNTFFNLNDIRGAISDGTNYWASGASVANVDGINYYAPGTQVGLATSANPPKAYGLRIFNGEIYYSTQKAGPTNTASQLGIFKLGSGLPTSGTVTVTQIINTGTIIPEDFSFNPSLDVCYIAINLNTAAGGIQKWTKSGAIWSLAYTLGTGVSNTGAYGLLVDYSGANPVIYATTFDATGNRVIKITDTGAASAATTIVPAVTGVFYKGISFAPVDAGTPTVNLSVSPNTGSETGATVITVTATSSSPVTGNQTLTLNVSGTGITPGDYTLSNSAITIPNGSTTGSVTFTIVDDAAIEGNEIAALTISNPSAGVLLGGITSQNVTIIDNDANNPPSIGMNVASTSDFIDGGVITAPASPYGLSGVIGDPTDPASTLGVDFNVTDVETPSASLTVTATSSNTIVVPNANINVSGSGVTRKVKITPVAVGYSNITVTVNDGTNSTSYIIMYAASDPSPIINVANTFWHTGMSDGSDAIALDNNYYMSGDDELNILNVYSRSASGLPLASYNYTSNLALPDPAKPEVDVEAATRSTANANEVYWTGSMSNGKAPFDNKPNRDRLFATTVTGTGAATSFSFSGYVNIRTALLAWGDTNGYNFTASAAAGVDSKALNGFSLEGMVFGPDNTTMYLGLRAPLVPTTFRHNAVIAPILNFEAWFNNGSPSGPPTFGPPIELDLNITGIRDITRLSNGTYIILSGSPIDQGGVNHMYKWTGNPSDAPVEVITTAANLLNWEGLMQVNDSTGGTLSLSKLQIISDGGTQILYQDSNEAKDFGDLKLRKFRSDVITGLDLNICSGFTASITQSGNTALCAGDSVTLTASAGNTYLWSTGATTQVIKIGLGGSGTYTVTVTNSTGCSAGSAKSVNVAHALPSDFNGDNVTNTIDFLQMLGVFNQSCTCPEDLNHDGVVDTIDFLILLGEFNHICGGGTFN